MKKSMECHTCVWNGRLAEFADKPWEETPCCGCDYVPDSRYTLEQRGTAAALTPEAGPGDDLLPVAVLNEAARAVIDLPPATHEVVRLRLRGLGFAEIGFRLGMTENAAECRVRKLLEAYPVFKALFPPRAGKARRRALQRPA